MPFTTVDKVVETSQLRLEEVYREHLGTGDGTKTVFFTENKPIYDTSEVTIFLDTNSTGSVNYTITEYRGKVAMTAAVANNVSVYATYPYCDVTSNFINQTITRADRVVVKSVNDTTNATDMDQLSQFMSAHLIYKSLAAGDARTGTTSYSVGYMSVNKGVSDQKEMSKMFLDEFNDYIKRYYGEDTFAALSHRQTKNKETERYYTEFELVEETED